MYVATKVVCFVCQIVEQGYLHSDTVCTNQFDSRLIDKSSEVASIDTHRKGILSN